MVIGRYLVFAPAKISESQQQTYTGGNHDTPLGKNTHTLPNAKLLTNTQKRVKRERLPGVGLV